MIERPTRPFLKYALLVLAFVATVLVAAGLWVCSSLSIALHDLQRIRFTQSLVLRTLALQLSEDDGLQEFARFRVKFFNDAALAALAASELQSAEAEVVRCCGHKADRQFSEAQQAAKTWNERVAQPIVAHSRNAIGPRSLLIATDGKVLMDQYSADLGEIDDILDADAQKTTGDVDQAINRVVYIFAGLIIVLVLATIGCRLLVVSRAT